jgi:SSS family solute:Na+ symporter
MGLSGLTFVIVSLMTKKSSIYNLAPFFPGEAKALERDEVSSINKESAEYTDYSGALRTEKIGERSHMQLELKASAPLNWERFVAELRKNHEAWFTSSGRNNVYRLTHGDLLSCPNITRGKTEQEIWISAEPKTAGFEIAEVEVFLAYDEIAKTLRSMGILTDFVIHENKSIY